MHSVTRNKRVLEADFCFNSGPDTKNKDDFMESCDARTDEMFSSMRGWKMKVYQGPADMKKMPESYAGYPLLGEAVVNTVDLQNIAAFRSQVKNTPDANFAWVLGGTLTIDKAGKYTLCTKSDDGSFLYVNDNLLVNNDGLHGPEQKCGEIDLTATEHSVVAVGFQHGGGAFMQVTYKGPDTNNQERFIDSTLRRDAEQWSSGSGWIFKIFQGPTDMTSIPSINGLRKLGEAVVQTVDIRSDGQFRERVVQTPSAHYVWVVGGTLEVTQAGAWLRTVPEHLATFPLFVVFGVLVP
jgi:hypothetical protein